MAIPQRDATRQRRISRSEDRPSRSFLNDLAAKVVQRILGVDGIIIGQRGTNITIGQHRGPRASSPVRFLAVFTGSTLQAGHQARWDYTPFAEVALTATGYSVVTDGRTGTAINLVELAHIAEPAGDQPWYVWGVQSHVDYGGNYPAGFRPRPVGGGGTTGTHKVDQIVELTIRTNSAGTTVYTFEAMGSHDGTCTV